MGMKIYKIVFLLLLVGFNEFCMQGAEIAPAKRRLFESPVTSPSKASPLSPEASDKKRARRESNAGAETESITEFERKLLQIPEIATIKNESKRAVVVTYPEKGELLRQKILEPQGYLKMATFSQLKLDQGEKLTIVTKKTIFTIVYREKARAFECSDVNMPDARPRVWEPMSKKVLIDIDEAGDLHFESLRPA
jgi:hypothetical protein